MGVMIGEAQWSYSGFNDMRRRVASTMGFDLNRRIGWGGDISWKEFNHPLREFFTMADAGGDITPESCANMARCLREVLANPNAENHLAGEHDRIGIALMVKALEGAANKGVALHYS